MAAVDLEAGWGKQRCPYSNDWASFIESSDRWPAWLTVKLEMKLRYFRDGGSDKHLRDVASILQVQNEQIDRAYISHWAKKLDVESEWHVVQQRVDKPDKFPAP